MASAALCGACANAPDFQVLSESERLADQAKPPRRSAIFDEKTIRLRGARGETVGLEVRIAKGTQTVSLSLPDSPARVTGFSSRPLDVKDPSTDMYGPSAGTGEYPDILVPSDGPTRASELAYFDVAIPRSAKPGRYQGELDVDGRTLQVSLEVSRARIDLEHDPLVWVFYSPRDIAAAHGLSDGDGPELIQKEAEYDALFRAHGAYLASDLPPDRFEPRRRFVHDVKYWPVAVDTTNDDTIARDVRRWLEIFEGTGVTPFAIPIDEPHTEDERERARHIGEVIGRAGGGWPRLLRAVTDVASPFYGDAIDVFVSPRNIPPSSFERTRSGEHLWTYNGKPPGAGSMILDTEGSALRTWGWIAARYDVELWYAWEGLYFSDHYNGGGPTDVMRNAITFDERRRKNPGTDYGNGDGVLAYPGPLPSLRLKMLRRGLEDRLLLRELERCGGDVGRELERQTVPRALAEASGSPTWPSSEVAWERARGRVLDAIDERCHEEP